MRSSRRCRTADGRRAAPDRGRGRSPRRRRIDAGSAPVAGATTDLQELADEVVERAGRRRAIHRERLGDVGRGRVRQAADEVGAQTEQLRQAPAVGNAERAALRRDVRRRVLDRRRAAARRSTAGCQPLSSACRCCWSACRRARCRSRRRSDASRAALRAPPVACARASRAHADRDDAIEARRVERRRRAGCARAMPTQTAASKSTSQLAARRARSGAPVTGSRVEPRIRLRRIRAERRDRRESAAPTTRSISRRLRRRMAA